MSTKNRRLLWLLNHKTLMPFEVPLLQSLGFEVFTPKVLPNDANDFRSTVVDFSYDQSLTLPDYVLQRLNSFDFYADRPWPDEIVDYLNRYFGTAITCIMKYPFQGILTRFSGKIIMRIFGVDNTMTYGKILRLFFGDQINVWLEAVRDRFWFGQSYEQLSECEDKYLRDRALFLPVGIPRRIWNHENTWRGTEKQVMFVCSNINDNPYYTKVYRDFKEQFGHLPHIIVGQQGSRVEDKHVLSNLSNDEFYKLFQDSAVLYYHSRELRHLHYTPLEAVVFGTPIVFYKDSLLGRIAGEDISGAAGNISQARDLVERLIQGDVATIKSIQLSQQRIKSLFTREHCERIFRSSLLREGILEPADGHKVSHQALEKTSGSYTEIVWFDSIALENGLVTPGVAPHQVLKKRADILLHGLKPGETVLDYGDGDGFFAFAAEGRGAGRVVYVALGSTDAFLFARGALESAVELGHVNAVTDGGLRESFDVVMLRGELNHTRHPLFVLERFANITKKCLLIETILDMQEIDRPLMVYYGDQSRPEYPPDGFGFNFLFLKSILLKLGFASVSMIPTPDAPKVRGIIRATR